MSAEQTLLQESIGKYLARAAPRERVKHFADSGEPRAEDIWHGLSDLGVPGILIAEEYGGIGCGLLDAALVAETLATFVAPVPFVSTAVMVPLAIALAGTDAQKSRWLPRLSEGSTIAGSALSEVVSARLDAQVRAAGATLHGRALFVLDFEAEIYLVADESRQLYLVAADAPGLSRRGLTTIDGTRRLGELVFDDVPAELLPGSRDAEVCARVLDAGRIVLATDTLGAAEHMLAQAVAYAKQRVQFGRPIGSFQAVKHLCAEMAAELEPCRALVWYAAHSFDAVPHEARLSACHAKAHLAEVGTFVARTAIEVHGGIGFTDELGLHLWFKRIGANRQLLGGPERVRGEAAQLQQWA
ncbi:MAG TPA: acyl-CoA dehydrogenase family protein [Pirellulales bacterium]|nr:acyl-CoA dehydrogenase family protein [Pirellulales bacterium]